MTLADLRSSPDLNKAGKSLIRVLDHEETSTTPLFKLMTSSEIETSLRKARHKSTAVSS